LTDVQRTEMGALTDLLIYYRNGALLTLLQ